MFTRQFTNYNLACYIYWLPWWLRQSRICLQCGRPRFDPWIWKIPWRRKWLPNPVFLPEELHGQRSLVGHSPWDSKESDMTEATEHMYLLSYRIWVLRSLRLSIAKVILVLTLVLMTLVKVILLWVTQSLLVC